jgi:hypothetical protein
MLGIVGTTPSNETKNKYPLAWRCVERLKTFSLAKIVIALLPIFYSKGRGVLH